MPLPIYLLFYLWNLCPCYTFEALITKTFLVSALRQLFESSLHATPSCCSKSMCYATFQLCTSPARIYFHDNILHHYYTKQTVVSKGSPFPCDSCHPNCQNKLCKGTFSILWPASPPLFLCTHVNQAWFSAWSYKELLISLIVRL